MKIQMSVIAGVLLVIISSSQMLRAQTNIPLVKSEASMDRFDVVSTFDASGQSKINWNYSAVNGKYKQNCQGLEGKGEIFAAKSLSVPKEGNQTVFIIKGDFFVKLDEATKTDALSSEKVQAVVDKVIWKSDDGKTKVVLAHGTAFMRFTGPKKSSPPPAIFGNAAIVTQTSEPQFDLGDVLAPNIDTGATVPSATDSGTTSKQTDTNKQQALTLSRFTANPGKILGANPPKYRLKSIPANDLPKEFHFEAYGMMNWPKDYTPPSPAPYTASDKERIIAEGHFYLEFGGGGGMRNNGEFQLDKNLNPLKGIWDGDKDGAIHTIVGNLTMYDYEFSSDDKVPLVFKLTKDGYVYLEGKGTVKDLKTGEKHTLE